MTTLRKNATLITALVTLCLLLGVLPVLAASAPTSTTNAATGIGPDSATLNGTVNDNGAATSVGFEYGATISYGSSVSATPRTLSAGAGATVVSAAITGLTCNTTYHFRVNGQNSAGFGSGSDTTFTTSACVVPSAPTIGTATAGNASAIVTFASPVTTGGAAITGYTVTSSPGGLTGTGTTSPIVVSGLTNGAAYTFTVTATNSVGMGSASAASNSVTPSATSLGISSVKVAYLDITPSPTVATLYVAATNGTLGISAFAITDTTTPASTVTVTGASYANGVYTLTATGMNVNDTYTLTVTAGGYDTYTNTTIIYGRPSQAADLDLVNEPNIFTTYTRTLTEDGVVTIGNATYSANAVLYSGTVYAAIDTNNGNPDNGSVVRYIGIFGKAPSGAKCVKTLRTNGTILQVANDLLIDANPNLQETIQSGKDAYTAPTSGTTYWQTLSLMPMYSQIATAQKNPPTDTSRTLVDPADGFRIIEWFDSVDGSGNCTGIPMDVQRLTVKVEYTGNTIADMIGSVTSVTTQPADLSVSIGGTAYLSMLPTTNNGNLYLQWYSNTTDSSSGGTLISGATSWEYIAPTTTAGTTYYYCMVNNSATGGISGGVTRAAKVVVLAAQTIGAISVNPTTLTVSGTATAGATATSSLAVTFTSLTTDVCTVSGATVTGVTAGVCTIAADQAGNATYDAATRVTKNITVAAVANKVHLKHNSVTTDYTTIQSAVDAAVDGDTINVDAGTFVEQVAITKNITLQGAGIDQTVVRSPASNSLTQSGGTWKNLKDQDVFAIIGIKTTTAGTVTIKNLTVDGYDQGFLSDTRYPDKNTYDFEGIGVLNTTAIIDTVKVTGVRELASQFNYITPADYLPSDQPAGMNHNASIFAESASGAGSHTLTVTNSTITKFQKPAILAWGPTLTVDINNNTIQGYGKTLYSTGNAIQIASSDRSGMGGANGDRRGTSGSIINNQILNIGIVIPESGQPGSYLNLGLLGPAGIVLWQTVSGFQVTGNTITGPGVPAWHNAGSSDDGGYINVGILIHASPNAVVQNNTVSGFDVAIEDESAVAGSQLTASGNTVSNNSMDFWLDAGNDLITLGNGPETVTYFTDSNGIDTITNFGVGDRINVIGYATGSVNGLIGSNPVYMTDALGNSVINGYTDGVPVVDFTGGTVTSGDGTNVAAKSVQVNASGGNTTLYIDTNDVAGAPELQITLVGTYVPANFTLSGGYISFVKQNQSIGAVSVTPAPLTVSGTATASATATSGLAVTFSSLTTGVCTVSGATVTGIAAGICTIAADQAGDAYYNAAAQATQSVTVAGTANTVHLTSGGSGTTVNYTTIQSAVDAAVDGDTINLDAGIFVEQVTITKAITLQGAGIGQTIIRSPAAASLTQSGGTWKNLKDQNIYAIIGIKTNAAGLVTIKNLTVDGNDQGFLNTHYPTALLSTYEYTYDFQGIGVFNSTATIDTVKVTGVRALATSFGNTIPAGYLPQDQPAGPNHNEGIFAESTASAAAHTVTVTNSTITKYQRTGVLAWGPTLTVVIDNNTFQGYGKTLYSRGNAIQIASTDRTSIGGANGDRRGTTGSVTNNHILNIGIVIPAPGQDGSYLDLSYGAPSGVVLWQAGSGVQITGNTITGPGVSSWHSNATSNDGGYGNSGIDIYNSANAVANNNTVSGFDVSILDEGTAGGSHLSASGNTFSNNGIDLWGNSGDDQFTLGSGAETIAYNQTGNGMDTITGFGAEDRIFVVGYTSGSVNDTIGSNPVYVTDVNSASVINGYTDGVPVVNFTGGTVTSGNGTSVAAKSVQINASGGNTTLYVNTDGVSGSQLQITLAGTYTPANFTLSGGYISFVKQNQTIGAISFSPASITVGGSTTAGATATSGVAVSFTSTTPAVCSVSGTTVTGFAAGVCTIAADQAGNAYYNAAGQVTADLTISKSGQTIGTITFTPSSLTVGSTTTAVATATSGLAVSFSSATPAVCTVSSTTVTGTGPGTCIINASQAGNANYNAAATVSHSLTVAYSSTPLTLTISALSDGAVTTDATINISGMVSARANLSSLTINGATVQVNIDGSFSYPVQLIVGTNTITIVATSTAGVVTSGSRTITLDSTAPKLTVTYPPDNGIAIQQTIIVTGTIADLLSTSTAKTVAEVATLDAVTSTVTYSVNGSTPQAASQTDTTYTFSAPLGSGMNTIKVFATTIGGLTVEAKRTVAYQPAFSLAVTDPAADVHLTLNSYILSGSVTDNTTPVTVTIVSDGRSYTPTVTNGVFQQQLSFTADKTYQISITGVDQNNNSLTVQRNIIHTIPTIVDPGGSNTFTIVDALQALQMSVGITTPTTSQTLRMDVAPMVNGVSVGDGKVDVEDAMVILRMAVGLIQ